MRLVDCIRVLVCRPEHRARVKTRPNAGTAAGQEQEETQPAAAAAEATDHNVVQAMNAITAAEDALEQALGRSTAVIALLAAARRSINR